MRLIDADEVKRAICQDQCELPDGCGGSCEMTDYIEDAPTIKVEQVRHAHWNGWTATHWTKKYDDNGDPIYTEHTYYQCSECRRRTVIKSAYCPACGRKMDEVSE